MLKLTTDKHEASRGLSSTAELLVLLVLLVRLQIYHCVQLNSLLFSSLRRIRPCCRPSQTNIRWCVADCVIYTASSSVNVFGTSHIQQSSIASY